jgi:hypothetical protein
MENTGANESMLSNEDVAKYIRPITSIVAYEANNIDNLQIVMRKLDLVRIHARSILEKAKNTNTNED